MTNPIPRFPQILSRPDLLSLGYRYLYFNRTVEETIADLFKKGLAKGTVTQSTGNEATAVGMGIPFRPERDICAVLHRDLSVHLTQGYDLYKIFCQFLANKESPTHAREGNVHFGDAAARRFPMISHLGNMLSLAVGGTWAARERGESAFGLTVIGDGGTSTGEFHEALNIASVRRVPVLFIIENNEYAFSTPTRLQYHCEALADRAAGYGIPGRTIDGTDLWKVYSSVTNALAWMEKHQLPFLLESRTLRLNGHAVYDKADYVTAEERERWMQQEPVAKTRKLVLAEGVYTTETITQMEATIRREVKETCDRALAVSRPDPRSQVFSPFAPVAQKTVPPFTAHNVRNFTAVNLALDYLLEQEPDAFLLGQDIGPYGSAFKTCKGLFEKHGEKRVLDMPICESATVGFALGASQIGKRPIMEFQFADFSTEAVTQLGLNCATWFFRTGLPAPTLFRLPCGGGVTLGAFHSGEFEGLWSRFPGLKILYPVTPQETFEAIVAGFYDPNPVIVLEHKFLYTTKKGDISFDGDLTKLLHTRTHLQGEDATVVALGAMMDKVATVAQRRSLTIDLFNPFLLNPLDIDPICQSVRKTGRLLVVQESGRTAGLADRFVSLALRKVFSSLRSSPVVCGAPDMPVPFAPELEKVYLPDETSIEHAFDTLFGDPS